MAGLLPGGGGFPLGAPGAQMIPIAGLLPVDRWYLLAMVMDEAAVVEPARGHPLLQRR